jgi:hypothetical protein
LKAPLRFSETRFATYSEQVKKNYVDNYPAFYNTLQETRGDKLDKINNAELILQVSSSIDTYKAIIEVPRKVQDPALFPWQVDKAVDYGFADLRKIACQLRQEVDNFGLDNQPAVGGKSTTKFFHSAKSEIMRDGNFKGQPLFANEQMPRASRSQSRQSTATLTFDNTIKKVGSDAVVFYLNKDLYKEGYP